MDAYELVHESLITLWLDTIEHTIDNYFENVRDKCVVEILGHRLSEEVKSWRSKRYETKLKYAAFPFRKTMEKFDFSFQKSIDRSIIDGIMTMRFVNSGRTLHFRSA